jgi:hypothetical protein
MGGNIMNTGQMNPQAMDADQLDGIKKQIIQTYLYLVSRTGYDPKVIEVMKLSALADVQRRYEAGEPW